MNFNFSDIIVGEVVREARVYPSTPKNPEGMTIRIFKDGAVYPSEDLVNHFDLEYKSKDSAIQGNGLDIVDSSKWGKQYPASGPHYIFVTASSKSLPKVDLFAQVNYDEEGNPIKSVLEQGSKRPELIELIRDMYNLNLRTELTSEGEKVVDDLFKGKSYVDLDVNVDVSLPTATNIFHLPKYVSRGPKKGSSDYVRRENSVFHPLTVVVNNSVEVAVESEHEVE